MIILMARPWKHPKNGTFYYRGRVPADLAKELKGKQIGITVGDEPSLVRFGAVCKVSLRTKSANDAKARHADVEAQLQKFWDGTRRGAVSLTFEQVCALAGELYRETLAAHEREPGSPSDWEFLQGQLSDALGWFERDEDGQPLNPKQGEHDVSKLAPVDQFLALRGLKLSPVAHRQFVEQAGGALWRAYGVLARRARGDYAADENATRFPAWAGMPRTEGPRSSGVGLLELVDGWAKEGPLAAGTPDAYRSYLEDFIEVLGHDDATRITRKDVIRWKDTLVTRGGSAKTINDSKLAALKAVLSWAVDNDHLPQNPATGVNIRVRKRAGQEMKGFSAEEAATIFAAAERETSVVYRWVPVLCALSGARVSEICQLRAEDIQREHGITYMQITAAAGSVKTVSSERRVPLHPYLVENGFLEFVKTKGSGPLFYDPSRRRADAKKPAAKIVAKNVAAWVHRLGIEVGRAHRKDPNHAWRHYFITVARDDERVKDSVLRRLVGHGAKNVNQSYGEATLRVLAKTVEAIPVPRAQSQEAGQ